MNYRSGAHINAVREWVRLQEERLLHTGFCQHSDTATALSHPSANQLRVSMAPFHDLTNTGSRARTCIHQAISLLSPLRPFPQLQAVGELNGHLSTQQNWNLCSGVSLCFHSLPDSRHHLDPRTHSWPWKAVPAPFCPMKRQVCGSSRYSPQMWQERGGRVHRICAPPSSQSTPGDDNTFQSQHKGT